MPSESPVNTSHPKPAARSLFVFNRDLRTDDHALLQQACADSEQILFLCCLQPWEFTSPCGSEPAMGQARWGFLHASLVALDRALQRHGHRLVVRFGDWADVLPELQMQHGFTHVYYSHVAGHYEQQTWQRLTALGPELTWVRDHTTTLYQAADLPFVVADLPQHFTPFRKRVEPLQVAAPVAEPTAWPQPILPQKPAWPSGLKVVTDDHNNGRFIGGQQAGMDHMQRYMNSGLPGTYKQVRNDLLGWDHSTKLSPWLALGCVSPRQVMQALRLHERQFGANESTYWIFFELLWREFFHWNAVKQGAGLFRNHQPRPFDAARQSRYARWCQGQTGVGLIDACMRQLQQTGYLSNRGRQLAASYLIHEAAVDWRAGAQFFEQQLLDYDVASNWGNWQYIAGDGADPRGGRHFNLEKQQQTHDPQGRFVQRWSAAVVTTRPVTWSSVADA